MSLTGWGEGREAKGEGVNRQIDSLSSQEMEGTCSCLDAPRGQTPGLAALPEPQRCSP